MPSSALLAEVRPPGAPKLTLATERAEDRARVDALIEAAFGPGRYAKTAERVREVSIPAPGLSFCAWCGGDLAGAVRMHPIGIGGAPALFLGPIAVDSARRRRGLGALLVERACEAALAAGETLVLLVGDRPFFEPLGFAPAPASVVLPGPVDARRVLWRALRPVAAEGASGAVVGRSWP